MVRFLIALGLIIFGAGLLDLPAQNPPLLPAQKLTDFHQIHRRFTNGTVNVIVTVASPVSPTAADFRSPAALGRLRPLLRKAQQDVLDTLPAADLKVGFRFDNLAGFSAQVTTNGLQALQAHPGVQTIEPVMELEPHLAQGVALIHGMTYRSTYNGAGVAIAICDTGIDYTHARLGGGGFPNSKILGGYDFGDSDANPIPNAQAHGTCCAGIAAGDLGTVGDYIGGVAYNAKLYALKISSGTTGSATTAAMVAAWDWCVTHQNDNPNFPIMVISTSFGGGQYFSTCDSITPSMTTAANNAVAAGITVLASSGNDGYCDSMGWPACVSSVISVGAVYDAAFGSYLPCVSSASCAPKIATGGCTTGWYVNDSTAADKVTAYANVASFLTLFAPANQCYTLDITGISGYSSGDYYDSFGGTSAACPYAAGAVACLQSAAMALTGNFLTPATVKNLLLASGDNVTDTKIAITKPRVNLESAILSLDTNLVSRFTGNPTNGGAPLMVMFTNQSANATNYLWDFGDGKSSSAVNPANTYTNAGSYTVQLTAVGQQGTNVLIRTNYILVTNAVPTITGQPQNQTVNAGANATFTVTAIGTPPLGYQWRMYGTNIPGATASSYTRTNAQPADMGPYSVVVSNIVGSVVSSNANLMVVVSPGIISVTGVPYTESFDSMGVSGTSTPFGWYVGTGSGAVSSTTVTVGDGSSNGRDNYNFGSSDSPDRALGSLAGNSLQRDTEARFINVSGLYIASLTVNYSGEQWRRGGNNSVNNQLILQYSTDGTTFTPLGAAFNFDTPIDSGSATALDGNAPANRVTGIGGTFTPSNSIPNGQVFYLRWADADDFGFDHGLALDDLVITFSVTNPAPVITVPPQSQSVTLGSNATFTVVATGVPPLAFQWLFNSTNIAGATTTALALTNVQTANAGGYSVVVTNSGGATTSTVATLTVNLPLVANFIASPTNGLAPLTVAFTNLSVNATDVVWDFGDGNTSTNADPLNIYSNAGSFTVTLTAVGTGGTNTLTLLNYIVVTNYPPPLADFAADPTNGLAPLAVTFTNLSLNATEFTWDFGDGNTSTNANPLNTYSNAGNFTVTLTAVGAGGTNVLTRTNYIGVTNYPPPVADFTADATNGLAPLTVTFTNLSLNATDFAWDFGDGNTSTNANPLNTYSNADSFTVTLTAIGAGGTNTLTLLNYIVVTNYPPPVADFAADPTNGLAPLAVMFTNLSLNATEFTWDFGDGNTSTNADPLNIYSNAGSFTVTLTAIGAGGTNTLTLPNYIVVTNYPPPVADFAADPTNGLAPLAVTFTNLSLNATEFAWDFGDGNTSTNANPLNTYSNAGSFTVTLTAVGTGGTNVLTITNYIVITNFPPPVADFTADATNGLAPLTVTFTNLSLNATDFAWDFGDGNTSTNANPLNIYSNAGSFTVTLIAVGAGGTNVLTITNYIVVTNYPPPLADFAADPTNGLAPLTVTFTNLSLNATEFGWDFGDGNTSTNASPLNTYSNAGTYSVTLTAIGAGGTNLLSRTNYIVVTNFPPPLPDFVADPTNGLAPLAVMFTNLSLNATDFAWDFGDGNTSTNANPLNTYSNAGNFTVTLTVIGAGGTNVLTRTNYIVVTNYPPPVADFTADATNGLAPLTVTFTNLSLNATDFAWDFGDGNTSTNADPLNTYSNAGSFTVTLIAVGAGGTNVLTITNYIVITNFPPPVADFTADATNGLAPLTVTFTNLSLNATEFTWDFGDGNTTTNPEPLNIYSNAGNFTVTLTASGAGGTNVLARTNYILVLRPAQLLVSPMTLDFGNVLTGRLAHASFVVSNAGDVTLSATATNTLAPFSLLDATSNTVPSLAFDVPTLGATNLIVRFAPDAVGAFSNVVVFVSNGGDATNILTGIGVGAPLILWPALGGVDFTFAFDTAAGLTYEVQFKDSLDDPVWQTLQTVPGDGSKKIITNSIATPAQRFYRLRVE